MSHQYKVANGESLFLHHHIPAILVLLSVSGYALCGDCAGFAKLRESTANTCGDGVLGVGISGLRSEEGTERVAGEVWVLSICQEANSYLYDLVILVMLQISKDKIINICISN